MGAQDYLKIGSPRPRRSIPPRFTSSFSQLPIPGSRLCLYEDGTELTGDYFRSAPDNSELVLLTAGQTWQGCKCWGSWRLMGKWVWSEVQRVC